MKNKSRKMAVCAITAALGVVLMLLGAVLGLGTYVAPMYVGWCLIPIGKHCGIKYQTLLWLVISLLSALFVANIEQNLMFIFLFGWYPIARPRLQKLPKAVRFLVKFLLFNVIVVSLEAVLINILAPEAMELWSAVILMAIGNAAFFLYDFAFPVFELLSERCLKKFFFTRRLFE